MVDDETERDDATHQGDEDQPHYLTAEEILSSVPIQFNLRNRPVRLQALSGEEFDKLISDASNSAFDDREFVARFIARQAVQPELDPNDVAAWSDDELLESLRQWIEQSDDEVDVDGDLSFASFRAWARSEAERIQSEMQRIYDNFRLNPGMEEAMRTIKRLTPTIDQNLVGRLIEPIPRAQLEGLLGPSRQLEELIRNAGAMTSKVGPVQSIPTRISTQLPPAIGPTRSPGADLADLYAAKHEADRARELRTIEQTEAAKELVRISKGQSTALQAMVTELQGLRDDQKTSTHWARWAAIAAGIGALVAAIGVAATIWLSLAGGAAAPASPAASATPTITVSPTE